ncbi:hypothetical protein [Stygiolobus caldivivus]|uniref:Uncharacterized protein n=1 Tax=Stygiolobus caldivivus TaxID=2824673 RepID=A0A8D5U5G0_9CREN|nr:hypothetical protein [Stygiolobus caldivivus]BCU69249.1 hypothetical protein KN1_05460 [Stygiolobus caldivivus]
MAFLVFNPRRWDLLSIDPFDFGLEKFVEPSKAQVEFENLIKILGELGEVKDICNIIDKEKLIEVVLESMTIIGEGKLEEEKFKSSISSLDKDALCNLFVLNPTLILSESSNRSVPKLRLFSEKIRGELLWLHKYAIIDNAVIIGYPSINSSKTEIKLIYYSLCKETGQEPVIADYPPALLNFDDIIIDKNRNSILAQIGGSTNVEGLARLFRLKYPILAELYISDNFNKLPLSTFLRILNEDYILVNRDILNITRVDIYEYTTDNYHYKYTYNLKDFLNMINEKIIIVDSQDMSFLITNNKVVIKEETDKSVSSIFSQLGLDIIKLPMSELGTNYRGPYNLVIQY